MKPTPSAVEVKNTRTGTPTVNFRELYLDDFVCTCWNSVLNAPCCNTGSRRQLKCDGTLAETRFRLSAKRTILFKSAGASVHSTTSSRGVRINDSNAGYIMFRGSMKSTGYSLNSPVSPSISLPCVTVCHHISTGGFQILVKITIYIFMAAATSISYSSFHSAYALSGLDPLTVEELVYLVTQMPCAISLCWVHTRFCGCNGTEVRFSQRCSDLFLLIIPRLLHVCHCEITRLRQHCFAFSIWVDNREGIKISI